LPLFIKGLLKEGGRLFWFLSLAFTLDFGLGFSLCFELFGVGSFWKGKEFLKGKELLKANY
jgi:hypothetical protein